MKIKLRNGKPASEEAIFTLEAAMNTPLSHSFKEFLRAYDGVNPETNIFRITDSNDSGVNEFIPVGEILNARAQIENIPRKAYPGAWAEGGDYVFVDEGRNGAAFFWDHAVPDEPAELAPSFGANSILALRCTHLNRRFEDYWEGRRSA